MNHLFQKKQHTFFAHYLLLLLSVFCSSLVMAHTAYAGDSTLEGRWDMTINMADHEMPSWLEVRHSGTHTLVGDYVGGGGSARPISKINYSAGKFNFTIPPQWESGSDLYFEGTFDGNRLSGNLTAADGKNYSWTAVRAPSLHRTSKAAWGTPVKLFNGTSLNGWHAQGPNQWKAEKGILVSPHSGSNLVTDSRFNDFKLHIEFRYPQGSNSGVYLRGRYEVQIADSKGLEPSKDQLGALYGFIEPTEMAAKEAGAWQSYDITLIGRMVTVVCNGKTIICNRPIPGITGGAIDSKEGEPGPILIQGDHGPVEFRNIILTPAR
jgi:hypothetical protein